MSSNRRFLAGLVACLFLVAGCGDKKDKAASGEAAGASPAASAGAVAATGAAAAGAATTGTPAAPPPPAAMMELVPEGTVAVVYAPSVKGLEDDVHRLMDAVDKEPGEKPGVAQLAQQLGVDPADLDMTRSAAVAVTMAPGSPAPVMTAILPVRDEKSLGPKLKAKMPEATVEAAGGYAAVTPEGPYKRGGVPAQMKGPLPAGDLVVRLDVATLAKTFGPMLKAKEDELLEAMKEQPGNPTASVKPMMDGLQSVIDSSSIWDLAIRIDGTMVELDATAHFTGGAKPPAFDVFGKTDLAALARMLPPGEGMLSLAMSMNPEKMWTAFQPFMKASLEVYPEATRQAMEKLMAAAGGIMRVAGQGVASSGGLTKSGLEMTGVVEANDPAAYIKSAADIVSKLDVKDSGITVAPAEESKVDGIPVTTLRVKMDVEKLMPSEGTPPGAREAMTKMFGKDGIRASYAAMGKRVVFTLGGDEVMKRALAAAKAGDAAPPNAFSKALAAAGPDAVGYLRYDLTALMRTVSEIMPPIGGKPMTPPPAGDPAVLTLIMHAGTNELRGRVSCDVAKMVKLFESMKPK